jgi:Ion channel regulatory protein UNC-93
MKSVNIESRNKVSNDLRANLTTVARLQANEQNSLLSNHSNGELDGVDSKSYRAAHWMTLAFAVLFFGVGAVQQYIAVWFQDRGIPHVGKNTLVLVYLFYFLCAFQAHRVINFLGCRLCMIATSMTYVLLIVSVWSGSEILSYVIAAVSGLMASLLWTGQTIVLNRISDSKLRATAVGQFWTRYPLGTGSGTLTLGLLIGQFSYSTPVLCFGLFALASCLLFWQMPSESKSLNLTSSSRIPSFHMVTLGSALTVFFVRFVYGLVISQVPIDLRESIGTAYIGLVSSPFFVLPIIISKPITFFANKFGLFSLASVGFVISGIGVCCLLLPRSGTSTSFGVLLIALSSAIINPVSNLLPKWITESTAIDLSRIAGTFSLAGSSGTLVGLLSVTLLSRTNAYIAAIVLLVISASCLWLVARIVASRTTSAAR